ncbi:MAG: GspMb/PilO family protein [Hydrogenophaga sp.]|nr:GspMb/PilO family protein [Hydrogenophaga sp.]
MKPVKLSPVRAIQFALLLLLALAIVGAGRFVWSNHLRMDQLLVDISARHARLQGILKSEDDLRALHRQALDVIKAHAYPAQQDITQAGNDAQQRIQGAFAAQSLSVISIQVLPPQPDAQGFDLIPVQVHAEGGIEAINRALQALLTNSPAAPSIGIHGLQIQSVGAVRADAPVRLSGKFRFFVLRGQA